MKRSFKILVFLFSLAVVMEAALVRSPLYIFLLTFNFFLLCLCLDGRGLRNPFWVLILGGIIDEIHLREREGERISCCAKTFFSCCFMFVVGS